MIPCAQQVKEKLAARERPQALLVITTRGGQYIYSDQRVEPEAESALGRPRFDGTRRFDGTWSFGSAAAVLGGGRKVKKGGWGTLRESLSTSQRSIQTGINQSDPDNITVTLAGDVAPLPVGARAELRLVWPGVAVRDGLRLFMGEVKSRQRSLKAGTAYKLVSVGQGLRESLKLPIIMKSAADYPAPRSETAKLPVVLGNMAEGGAGGQWEAVCLDSATYVYALAGHELTGGVELFGKDGEQINPSDFTLNLAHNYEAKGEIATATFAADAKDREPISARAQGRPVEAALPTNPVDLARDLLLGNCGMAATDLHGASWARARAVCEAQGYEAARAITSEAKRGDLLTGLLGNFCIYWWIGGDGLIRLLADGGSGYIDAAAIAGHLDAELTRDAQEQISTDDICNQVKFSYAPGLGGEWQAEDDGATTKDDISQQRHQVRLWELELPWASKLAVVNQVQRVLVARLGRERPRWTVRVPDCRLAHVERGDYLTVSSAWLPDENGAPLSYEIARIEQKQQDLASGGMTLVIQDTGYYRTQARRFDGTWSFNGQGQFGGERYQEVA